MLRGIRNILGEFRINFEVIIKNFQKIFGKH